MPRGYALILAGYVGWGLFPLYWMLLIHVPALEVLLHRMAWSLPLLLLLVALSAGRRRQVRAALASWRELRWLTLTGLIVSFNWGIYIWAVANARVIEASMGYFLTPLMSVLGGILVFGERLDRLRIAALACAAAGVVWYIVSTALVPWVSLLVGSSFAAYGLLRKKISTNAIPGLLIEILLLLQQKAPIQLESIDLPDTVIEMAIELESTAERNKLADILEFLKRQDPTFRASENEE